MIKTYAFPTYPYVRSADQDSAAPVRRPVVIGGAGPIGMALAVDLALHDIPVVVLDDNNTVSVGSRAVCYAKRLLEIMDRLGVGERMMQKGVTWNVGKVFFEDDQVYSFNMLPESHHRRPGFINLQQYYVEQYLVERIGDLEQVDLRWKNKITALEQQDDGVLLSIDTPEGPYQLEADYLVACDGANSGIRALCGLGSSGQVFQDRFLIADVLMDPKRFPPERWFWFNPPFHNGQSTLLHRQPDNVWRIDFDLGWEADPEEEKKPENINARVRAFLGEDVEFELEWASVYTFCCRRMDDFRHGRVLFAGDAAHQVSPFGARGANSGVQDTDNLAWKLALVLKRQAPAALLDSYTRERLQAADENILNSTRSTDFITPKNDASRALRDAVLNLSRRYAFARSMVNSGRLSLPSVYADSSLNTADTEPFAGSMVPGAPSTDGPVQRNGQDDYLLSALGNDFNALWFIDHASLPDAADMAILAQLATQALPIKTRLVSPVALDIQLPAGVELLVDHLGVVAERFDARPGTFYLMRPDQHVCGRGRSFDPLRIQTMQGTATGH
ncbi:FAD-dependent oxidoreductase [Marinobacterium sedimentorum]|uniref:FAD-dependent oxidoreductase n=1 Tax=Marinobacterium sedimentorum TaxID=2927804 RepID=UPI0020C6ED3E|nr:FAD-dependent oxidoreductase [Marinobacterium sedimentorum]MCP8686567.1 FAD-dependent oxidoreductase [Marinobacterium sedimentorum]